MTVLEKAKGLMEGVRELQREVCSGNPDDKGWRDVRIKCEAILTRLMQIEGILEKLSL